MTSHRRSLAAVAAVSFAFALGAGCTPSGNAVPPRIASDSDAEQNEARVSPRAHGRPAPVPTDAPADDVAEESPPLAVTPPPPPVPAPRVASRPVLVPRPSGPYRVRIVDANHRDLPTFAAGGRTYVMGEVGERYSIVIANPTPRRVEAVVSVDGLDAMDGHAANYLEKRGYILPAYGDASIDGFRTSFDSVATFRFSSVADSYAGRLGQARDVGVVGVAFFPERAPVYRAPLPEDFAPPPSSPARSTAHAGPAPAPEANDLGPSTPPAGGAAPRRATSPSERMAEKSSDRPGLGTEFGEARDSHIDMVSFTRANPASPSQVVAIRYNDRAGLVALGVDIPMPYASTDVDTRLRETADPFRASRFAQPPP